MHTFNKKSERIYSSCHSILVKQQVKVTVKNIVEIVVITIIVINESIKDTSYCGDTNKILKNISFEKLLYTLALF